MTVAAAVLALAIGGPLLWILGGLALRLGGGLVFWAGLVGLLAGGEAASLLVALLGGLIWLTGQGHHLLRHGGVRSPLARAMLRSLVDRPSGARSDRRAGVGRPEMDFHRRTDAAHSTAAKPPALFTRR